jgi:broad specificity phosphatase PhoE
MWLVRHGAAVTRRGACLGWTDAPLLDRAQTGADMAGLARDIGRADAVVSSDLRRAHETAGLLAVRLGCPLRVDRDLRELHFGAWEGCTWAEIERADPARYASFMRHWRRERPPGGESYAELAARVQRALTRIVATRCVVVAHAGSLRALASRLLDISPARAMELPFPPGGGMRIDRGSSGPAWIALRP